MKLKVFKFKISDYNTDPKKDHINTQEIEDEVNGFISDKDVVSMKVNTHTLFHHNNGRMDITYIIYSIMYK